MSRDKVAVDVSLTDRASIRVLGDTPPLSVEVAQMMALNLHRNAELELGRPEYCSWDWYAHDGGPGHDFVALKLDMGEFGYSNTEELLANWLEAEMPIVAAHYQKVIAPLVN